MQVILLAAGQSSRLAPIADKNLLEFSGRTLIEHQVAAVKHAKLRDIVVVGNAHNLERLKRSLKEYKNVTVVEQKDLKAGMAGGVLAGAGKVSHKNILILSTNDVVNPELFEKMIEEAKRERVDGAIAASKVETYFPGGYVKFDKNGFLTEIVEKPAEGKEPSKYVNFVFHIYNDFPKFLSYLKGAKSKKDDHYEVALDHYIKKGKAKMAVFKHHGYWQPLKYPWHILRMMEYLFKSQQPRVDRSAVISKKATVEGNVFIGPKVKIMDNAVIRGPAYIGEGSVIGNNAMVRESMIGTHCVIGFGTEVTRSYLNNNIWTHSTYIGDSIVDSNVSFGAGTVLGNLRFDEAAIKVNVGDKKIDTGTPKFGAIIGSGARFGINSSTNPGVKIGSHSFIGGNVLVDGDIPENKIVLLKQQLKMMANQAQADTTKRKSVK